MSQFFQTVNESNIPSDVATSYVTDLGTAVPLAHILNVLGGDGIQTEGSGNTVTIKVINLGFPWTEESTDFVAIPQNGYFCNASLTVFLPSIGIVTGSTVIIYIDTASPVIIQADVFQQIEISNTLSSFGGMATSTAQGNVVELVFKTSDQTWHTIASQGSFVMA